jgi:hypothetical protein
VAQAQLASSVRVLHSGALVQLSAVLESPSQVAVVALRVWPVG